MLFLINLLVLEEVMMAITSRGGNGKLKKILIICGSIYYSKNVSLLCGRLVVLSIHAMITASHHLSGVKQAQKNAH